METLTEKLDALIEKRARLEQYKQEHPEAVEGMQLAEEYHELYAEVLKSCQPQQMVYVPIPYNPLPYPPVYPWKITCGTSTMMVDGPHTCTVIQ